MSNTSVVFSADKGQFEAAVDSMTGSISKASEAVAVAKNKILDCFKQQSTAAVQAGRTSQEVARLQEQAAQRLASVTEQNANRMISSFDRIAARQRAVRMEMANVSNVVPFASGSGSNEIDKLAESTSHLTDSTRAVSGAFQEMEGKLPIRAVERFLGQSEALSGLLAKGFTAVGVIATAEALYQLGKRAYEAYQNVVNLKGVLDALGKTDLTVQARVRQNNDKIEGDVEDILHRNSGESAALRQRLGYESGKGIDLSDFFYSNEIKGLPDDVKGNYEKLYKDIPVEQIRARREQLTVEIGKLQDALNFNKQGLFGAAVTKVGDFGADNDRNPVAYMQARLKLAQQISAELNSGDDARTSGLQRTQSDLGAAQQKEAEEAARKAAEARRKAVEAQWQGFEDGLAKMKADHEVGLSEEKSYWTKLAAASSTYPENLRKAREKIATENQELLKGMDAYNKAFGENQRRTWENILKVFDEVDKHIEERRNRAAEAMNKAALAQAQGQGKLREAQLSDQLSGGDISRGEYAQRLANVHSDTFAAERADLERQLADATRIHGEGSAESITAQSAISKADLDRQIQMIGDAAAIAATRWQDAFKDANAKWYQDSQDTAKQVTALWSTLHDESNNNIANLMTGQKTDWSGEFRGIGHSLANNALNRVEAPIMNAFGLGKADGSSGNPFWVRMAGGLGSLGSSFGSAVSNSASALGAAAKSVTTGGADGTSPIGNVIGKIGGFVSSLFGGFRAAGGPVSGGSAYVVGEKGPELMIPGSSGTIIPNHMLGGSSPVTYNVSVANGVTPEQFEMRMQTVLKQYHPQVARTAVAANRDAQRRSPASRR